MDLRNRNCINFSHKLFDMNKQQGILLASAFGLILGLGYFGLKKYLGRTDKDYDDYYSDFHRHFENRYRADASEGIEFLGM